ncbi:MAG: YdcF family protein [Chloroflexota bacterium]|nr:YdcF family protein [Chloroflexota bacterium]
MPLGFQNWWTIDDNPPSHPECFVISSYALRDRSLPTKPTRAQIELAYQWWKRFPDAYLIMSSGDNQRLGITNAKVMADYAVGLGVPRGSIIEEDRSLNTHENLLYCLKIIEEKGLQQPTLVTLDLYTRRAVATARKLGWSDFYWLSVFSEGEPAYGYKWLQTRSRFTIFWYELFALLYSKMVGWV